jgi:hypothetical protein
MDWMYQEKPLEEIPEKAVGFVYLIEEIDTQRKYVGKKGFYASKTRQVKGKKKKTKVVSDYMGYWGSNEELQKLVKERGQEHFTRKILHICYSKAEMSYLELREQMDRRVLESDEYLNGWIMYRGRKDHLKSLRQR